MAGGFQGEEQFGPGVQQFHGNSSFPNPGAFRGGWPVVSQPCLVLAKNNTGEGKTQGARWFSLGQKEQFLRERSLAFWGKSVYTEAQEKLFWEAVLYERICHEQGKPHRRHRPGQAAGVPVRRGGSLFRHSVRQGQALPDARARGPLGGGEGRGQLRHELPGAGRAHAHWGGDDPPPVLALVRALPVPERVDGRVRPRRQEARALLDPRGAGTPRAPPSSRCATTASTWPRRTGWWWSP